MKTLHSQLPSLAGGALFAAALAFMPVAGAVTSGEFTTHSALTLSGKGPWYRLILPLAVQMRARHTDLRDLRVFDANGTAMPYALVRAAGRREQAETRSAVHIFPLRGVENSAQPQSAIRLRLGPDGTLLEVDPKAAAATSPGQGVRRGWLIDASAVKGTAQRLLLDWQSASGRDEGFQRFSISGSDDLRHWSTLGEGQIARLSFNGERIDQRSVDLGGRKVRYLRLLWESPHEAPLLTGVQVVSRQVTKHEAPVVWSGPMQTVRDKDGDYILTLPVALALEHLRVDLPQDNTLAPVAVAGRYTLAGGRRPDLWVPLTRAILYRLPADGAPGVNDRINLPGQAVRQLRLRIDRRGGGLGTGVVTLRVGLRATEVIFLARGQAPYSLAVGDAKEAAADLPLATLIPGYDGRGADIGSAALAGPPFTGVAETPVPTEAMQSGAWKRWVLWAVLMAGVALLAVMTLRLIRKPPE